MLATLSAPDRTVIWVGPPPFKNDHDNVAIQQISEVSKAVIARHPDAVFVDDYSMFLDANGKYTDRLPDANGNLINVRSGDGVHFTTEGGNQLARAVFGVIDAQCRVTAQAVAGVTKQTIQTEGSTLVAPGGNNRQGGTVATTPPATSPPATHATRATAPPETTAPPATDAAAARDDDRAADEPRRRSRNPDVRSRNGAHAVGRLPPMPDQLVAAAAAVDRATEIVDTATRTLARRVERRRTDLGRQTRRPSGARVRPRARSERARGVPRDAHVRRARRARVDARTRVHRRGDRRPRREGDRARRALGRRPRHPRRRAPLRRSAPVAAVPRNAGRDAAGVGNRAAPPLRGVRARRRHVPALRRRQDPARSPSTCTARIPTSPRT